MKDLTPREIVGELDKYIIGQDNAKRNVAVALRNRWRRMKAAEDIQGEIIPNNILLIGATGVGKTEIARRLARIANAPFTKVEASKFTEVGYVGRDVESMVRDLVEQAVNMVKTQKKEEVKEKAAEIVESKILDALIPPMRGNNAGFDVRNIENQPESELELNKQTRTRFMEKIRSGEMEDRKIEIDVLQSGSPNLGMMGGGAMDETSMINLQEMLSNMMPKRQKKRKVTIAEARKILMEDESSKLIDMDEVKEEALKLAENNGIIFIDEIDKVAARNGSGKSGPDVSREGVQRDLLPVVEGSAVSTKYGVVKTDHMLFVAAGAFHVSKPSDLIPELQGRFPIRVELENLTQADFLRILTEPKNALTKQYAALVGAEDVSLSFQDEALEEIAEMAFRINEELENIGARRLHTVMSKLLNEILYEIPDTIGPHAKIIIDRTLVKEKLSDLIKDKDLSKYIL